MTDDRDDKPKPPKRDQTWQPLSQTARLVETVPQDGKRRKTVPVEIKPRIKPPVTSVRSTFSRSQRTGVAIETKRRRPLPNVVESSEPEIVQSGEPPVVEAHDEAAIDLSLPNTATETLKDAMEASATNRLAEAARYSSVRTIEDHLAEIENSTVGKAMREAEAVRRASYNPYADLRDDTIHEALYADLDHAALDAQREIDRTVESATGGLYRTDRERRLAEADRIGRLVDRDLAPRPTQTDAIIEAKHRSNMKAVLSRFDVEHPVPALLPQMVRSDTNHIVGRDVSTTVVGLDGAAKAQAEREAREEARRDREIELAEAEHKHNIRNFWLTVVLGILGVAATIAGAVLFG